MHRPAFPKSIRVDVRLCLIRHFPPEVASGLCYGQTDLSLKDSASEDPARLEAIRERLRQYGVADAPVFSSPLRRCRELAEALSPTVMVDPRLAELDFGDWEMQTWDAIGPRALDAWAADIAGFRPPGGETGYELQVRALVWLREISACHEQAVVVSYAGVMRVLQAHHQGLSGKDWLNLRFGYGEMLCLEFTPGQIAAPPVQ